MIRLFSHLCKCFKAIDSKNEIDVFDSYMSSFDASALACPFCCAKHALSPFASYARHLVTYSNDSALDNSLSISRYVCSSCGHTHAILPPVIIPYMSFSFHFTIFIIHDYLIHTFNSVETMCEHYGIAITTFYRIFKRFKEHKKLWMGLMQDALHSHLTFNEDLLRSSFAALETFVLAFFYKTSLSFLQGNVIVRIT